MQKVVSQSGIALQHTFQSHLLTLMAHSLDQIDRFFGPTLVSSWLEGV